MRKLWLASTICVLTIGGWAGAGMAQGRLDRSFGQNGIVEVRPSLPASWSYGHPRDMAAARDGSSFVLFERRYCDGPTGCFGLFRYLSDGSLDAAFGGSGSYELSRENGGLPTPTLAVDSRGRPLLAQRIENRVIVRRLTSSGAPDASFGTNGVAAFECDCEYGETQLIPGPGRTVTVTVAVPRSHGTGAIFTIVRLDADGSTDLRFGNRGSTTFALHRPSRLFFSAMASGGALYLVGTRCCGLGLTDYIIRVSARGRLDSRFARASQRSLRSFSRLNSHYGSVNAVIVRPGGKIDLLGPIGSEGFVLRLNPSGRLHRRFGSNGLETLPLPVASAALGNDGAILAVSGNEFSSDPGTLLRILAGGHIDPAFGGGFGKRIPASGGDIGLSVAPQTRRRALVLDLGLKECRESCLAEPKLVRFLEGAPKRR